MTVRRIILLILLIIPAGFILYFLFNPIAQGGENMLEIIGTVICCPIVVLACWEYEDPKFLDELFSWK